MLGEVLLVNMFFSLKISYKLLINYKKQIEKSVNPPKLSD